MKKSVLLLGFAVVVSVGIAVKFSTRDEAGSVVGGADDAGDPTRDQQGIRSRRRLRGDACRLRLPAVPGTLSGKWRSSGKGGNNTLSGFTLTDPSDAVLDSSFKGSSGSFEVKVSAAGKHTFFFENAGAEADATPRDARRGVHTGQGIRFRKFRRLQPLNPGTQELFEPRL